MTTIRMKEMYENEVKQKLQEKFKYKNVMQIPSIEKIVINMGVGAGTADKKAVESAKEDMMKISGQAPVITRAKKSIAAFKLREETPVGCKVTLRGQKMYEFLDRLITIALPRVRDFEGLNPKSFDGRGNYAFGIKEQIIFQEIDFDKIDKIRGMDIIITTTAKTNEEARVLLDGFGMPFKKTAAERAAA